MSFVDFARFHGVDIDPGKLYPADKIKRCGTVERPNSDNGAYWWDGQRGWVMDWSGEARVVWYKDPHAKPWTPEEKLEWTLKRKTAASAKERSYELAAQRADVVLRSAKPEPHDYLILKGFPEHRGLVLDGALLVPMRNVVTNKIQGYQQIFWDEPARKWEKKMLPGMRAKNAVMYIGSREAPAAWLVEGYATGLSLLAALRSVGLHASVVVCFSASNLIAVADQIPGNRFVFADNDVSKTGENAAIQTGLPWTMADQVGYDVNDLHKNNGLFAVVAKIMAVRAKPVV